MFSLNSTHGKGAGIATRAAAADINFNASVICPQSSISLFQLYLAGKLIEVVGSDTIKEICSLWGYKSELDDLKDTITTIRKVLVDAESKDKLSHEAQDYIRKLNNAVYDADDLFDEFRTIAQLKQHNKDGKLSEKVLFYCMEKHLPELSMNWKRVELSMWLTEKHIPGLCRMLRNSPYLEDLVIDVTSWQSDFLQPIESKLDNCSMNEEDCCSRSLKSVVIYNTSMCSYPCLVHLISILLQNATVLAELVIYYKADDKSFYESVLSSEQWTEFSNNLLTFPRASQHLIVSLFKEI